MKIYTFEDYFKVNGKLLYVIAEYVQKCHDYLPEILSVRSYDEDNNEIVFPLKEQESLSEFIEYKSGTYCA